MPLFEHDPLDFAVADDDVHIDPDHDWEAPVDGQAPAQEAMPVIDGMEESYPEYPNFISLDRYMVTPRLMLYSREIEKGVFCTRGPDNFDIYVDLKKIIYITRNSITFNEGYRSDRTLKAINKYSGAMFDVSARSGAWVVKANDTTNAMYNGITYDLSTYNVLKQRYGVHYGDVNNELRAFETVVDKKIEKYCYYITPELISKSCGTQTRKNKIYTQCNGCNILQGSHLHSHIERYEINPYLIYAAMSMYGVGDATDETWNIIEKAREGELDGRLKPALKHFLRHNLTNLLIFTAPTSKSQYRWVRAPASLSSLDNWPSQF